MDRAEVTQWIRGADVILVMPLLLFASSKKSLPMKLRIALGITGIATGVYNGINLYTHWK